MAVLRPTTPREWRRRDVVVQPAEAYLLGGVEVAVADAHDIDLIGDDVADVVSDLVRESSARVLAAIYRKLGINGRIELFLYAGSHGLNSSPSLPDGKLPQTGAVSGRRA